MTILQIIIILAMIGLVVVTAIFNSKNKQVQTEYGSKNFVIGAALGLADGLLDSLGCNPEGSVVSVFKFTRCVKDKDIPGTIVVGSTIVLAFEFFIFSQYCSWDFAKILVFALASAAGAVAGSFLATKISRQLLCALMGTGLIIGAIISIQWALSLWPFSLIGVFCDIEGAQLFIAGVFYFVAGILSSFGISMYPLAMAIMLLFSCSVGESFVIIIGSTAISRIAGSFPYVIKKRFDLYGAIGMGVGGAIGVLIAWKICASLPGSGRFITILLSLVSVAGAIVFLVTSSKEETETSRFAIKSNTQIQPTTDYQTIDNTKANNKVSVEAQLKNLDDWKKLLDAGVINEDEFEEKKKEILSNIM